MSNPTTPEQKARRAAYLREWRAAHPEQVRDQQRRYREKHPDLVAERNRVTRERLGPDYWRAWHQGRKRVVIDRYGGICACCGESELLFLTIDHIEGGGRQDRLANGESGVFKRLLKAPERLPGYRILCMNCQFGFMHGRTCPHQLPEAIAPAS